MELLCFIFFSCYDSSLVYVRLCRPPCQVHRLHRMMNFITFAGYDGTFSQCSESPNCQIKSGSSVGCWVTALHKWEQVLRIHLEKVLLKTSVPNNQTHTRMCTTVFTRPPGPTMCWDSSLHNYWQLQHKQRRKIHINCTNSLLNMLKIRVDYYMYVTKTSVSQLSMRETHGSCFIVWFSDCAGELYICPESEKQRAKW